MGDGQELPEEYKSKCKYINDGQKPFIVNDGKQHRLKTIRAANTRYYKLGFRVRGKKVESVRKKCNLCGRWSCRRQDHASV